MSGVPPFFMPRPQLPYGLVLPCTSLSGANSGANFGRLRKSPPMTTILIDRTIADRTSEGRRPAQAHGQLDEGHKKEPRPREAAGAGGEAKENHSTIRFAHPHGHGQ